MVTIQQTPGDRLELALRASNEGIWQWDLVHNDVSYSERVLLFLGYPSGEVPNIFEDSYLYFHAEDLKMLEEALAQMLKPHGDEIFAVDCRYRRPDSQLVWLRLRGACVRDERGIATRIAGSMIDISKRKTTEQSLQEERHLLNQLIENIPNNIYFKDSKSRFVMVNKATAEKMGFEKAEELLGKSDHDFFDQAHADRSREDELEIMETRQPQQESIERETWEGQEDTWVLTTKIPWFDHSGKVKGTFGVTSDVSDMMNMQLRLSNVASELQRRNAEYEKELELARQVQQAVLLKNPKPFPAEGVESKFRAEFSMHYEPDSEMAGDFYEVFEINETQTGILICDVMGHGVRAALVVAMLRGLIEKESDSAAQPEWFLYGLNDSLAKIFTRANIQMFATALYVVVDAEKGTLSYASAGHPMPIITKNGVSSKLRSDKIVRGPALGLMAEAPYGSDIVDLAEIDQMVLYTDGIYEVADAAGEELGLDALITALNDRQPQYSRESLACILRTAIDHSENRGYGDDVCLLGIDFTEC